MSEIQRWVWTPDGMAPYRAHPLMPDVGGVFVSAEDVKAAKVLDDMADAYSTDRCVETKELSIICEEECRKGADAIRTRGR